MGFEAGVVDLVVDALFVGGVLGVAACEDEVEVETFVDELLEGGEEEVEAFLGGDAGEEEEEGAIGGEVVFRYQLLRQVLILQVGEADADGEDEVFGVVAKAFGGLLLFEAGEVEGCAAADVGGFEEGGVEFFGEGFFL